MFIFSYLPSELLNLHMHYSLLISFLFLLCPAIHIITLPFVSPLCTWQFDHGVALNQEFYPKLLICFAFSCYHILDWFLLIRSLFRSSNLLSLSVSPSPFFNKLFLVSPRSARVNFTMSSAGVQPSTPPPLFCFGFIYVLCIYCTFFPLLSHTLLMYIFSCVLLSHLLEFLLSRNVCLQSCSDYHTSPPSRPLVSSLLAGTRLLKTYRRPILL